MFQLKKSHPDAGRCQQAIGKKLFCNYCGKLLIVKGTRRYCYGGVCNKAEKRYRQSIVDGLAAKVKKGLYTNYKLFCKFLPYAGEVRIDYDKALKNGFDEHAYYGTYKIKHKNIWHIVGEYHFRILHQDDERFLDIIKLKEHGI